MATDVPSEEEVERLLRKLEENAVMNEEVPIKSHLQETARLTREAMASLRALRAALTRAVSEIEAAPHGNFCLASRCWYRWPKTGRFCGRCESAHDRLLHDWQPEACNCWKSRAFKELRRG